MGLVPFAIAICCCAVGTAKLSSESFKINEWAALGTLSKVKSLHYMSATFCEPQDNDAKRKSDFAIPNQSEFVQSEYLPWPMHVNFFEQICRISQGREPSVKPCTNHDFSLTYNAFATCASDQPVDLLLLISSNVTSYEHREAIRRLWANSACWLGARVKHIFLLETRSNTELSDSNISEEDDIYGDVVQQKFTEPDYANSTAFKILLGFRWSLAFCPQAKWLLFVNEDQFVNPFNTVSFLLSVSEAMRQRLVVGSVWYEPYARNAKQLWHQSLNSTATSDERYPTFVSTSGVLVSSVIVPSIYITMRFTQLPVHPDLFLAHALRKLFILPAHFHDFYAYNRQPSNTEQHERAIVFHGGSRVEQSEIWALLKCDKYCL